MTNQPNATNQPATNSPEFGGVKTQTLSAEELSSNPLQLMLKWLEDNAAIDYLGTTPEEIAEAAQDIAEAYAAQQTATLQATVSDLEAEVERYTEEINKLALLNLAYREAIPPALGQERNMDYLHECWMNESEYAHNYKQFLIDSFTENLKTENEQLHAKLAMLREAIAKRLSQPEAPGFPLIDAYKATEADVDQWLKTKISDAVLDSKVVTGKKFAMENEFYRQVGNI